MTHHIQGTCYHCGQLYEGHDVDVCIKRSDAHREYLQRLDKAKEKETKRKREREQGGKE